MKQKKAEWAEARRNMRKFAKRREAYNHFVVVLILTLVDLSVCRLYDLGPIVSARYEPINTNLDCLCLCV